MQERVLKAIADRDRRNSGSHVEVGEGTALVPHEGASVHDDFHREESSQDGTFLYQRGCEHWNPGT